MKIIRALFLIAFFASLSVAVAGITAIPPAHLPRVTRVVPPVDVKAVCAHLDADSPAYLSGAEKVGALGEKSSATKPQSVFTATSKAPYVATSSQPIIGGFLDSVGTGKAFSECSRPMNQGTLVVPTSANTDLVIVNSDGVEASVDLALYDQRGEVSAVGARGIALSPHSARTVSLAVLAPGEGPVGVRFSTTTGRVTVMARTAGGAVAASLGASEAATSHLFSGVPKDAQLVTLNVANPGNERAELKLQVFGGSATFEPAVEQELSVPAHSTLAVPLVASLNKETSGLQVTSDQPVVASLNVAKDPAKDQAYLSPTRESKALAAVLPPGGTVILTNPSQHDATVSVGGAKVTVAAGRSTEVAAPKEGNQAWVTSSEPVIGAVLLQAQDSLAAAALLDATPLRPVPMDAELDPSLR